MHLAVQRVVCGQPAICVLHTADEFGNAVLAGSADVHAHISLHTHADPQTAEVPI